MRFTPHYMVSYKGTFHQAGKQFDIDSADAEEMSKHGSIQEPVTKPVYQYNYNFENNIEKQDNEQVEKPVKKGGRPRKNNNG